MMRCCAFGALAFVSVAYAAQCTSEEGKIPEIQARLDMCPASAPFWGFMGCMMALVFSCECLWPALCGLRGFDRWLL